MVNVVLPYPKNDCGCRCPWLGAIVVWWWNCKLYGFEIFGVGYEWSVVLVWNVTEEFWMGAVVNTVVL